MKKEFIVKVYNENTDYESKLIFGEVKDMHDVFKMVKKLFSENYYNIFSKGDYRCVYINEIEIISYNDLGIIQEYIYECREVADKLNLDYKYLIETFLMNYVINLCLSREVFTK